MTRSLSSFGNCLLNVSFLFTKQKIDWKDSSALNNLITVLEQRKQNELRHHERLRQECEFDLYGRKKKEVLINFFLF